MAKKQESVPVVSQIPIDSVEVVKVKVENAVSEVATIVVKTDEDLTRAATVQTNVKKLQKFITQEKEKIIQPLIWHDIFHVFILGVQFLYLREIPK